MEKIKVVFISHDASRTGAPFVLLHLLRWLKENTEIEFITIFKDPSGDLLPEFNKISKTYAYWNIYHNDYSIKARVKRKLKKIKQLFSVQTISENEIIRFAPNIIYANTVVSCDIACEIHNFFPGKPKIICHIHELEVAINKYFGKKKFNQVKHKIDYYIAVSNAVKDNLKINHKIEANKIYLVNAFITAIKNAQLIRPNNIKKDLGLKETDTLITGCGTIDWRKSPDLFIQVGAYVISRSASQNIYFIWIGGEQNSIEFKHLSYDINNLQLADRIKIIGTIKNPIDYLANSDLFLMTSREDPYPLVCLEAASCAVPTICFANAGGIPEFVEEDAGIVAPYLDIVSMGNAVLELINNPDKIRLLGNTAQKKVIRKHDVSTAGKEIAAILNTI